MQSIEELIKNETTFAKDKASSNSVIGLGIGYLMEMANISDFTQTNYDSESKKTLRSYVDELNQAIPSLQDYFTIVANQDLGMAQQASQMIVPVIQANMDGFPNHLTDAFRYLIDSEDNSERKVELQLMELAMFSKLSSKNEDVLKQRFDRIDEGYLSEELKPVYLLAKNLVE